MPASKFSVDIAKFAKKIGLRHEVVVKRVLFELFADFQQRSPVDTGAFRANWMIGVTTRPSASDVNQVNQGAAMTAAAATIATINNSHRTFYIVNNLPYAMSLEYYHSSQAPSGVVRIAVEEWKRRVDAALSYAKREVP